MLGIMYIDTDYAEKMFHQATLENYGQAEMPE